LQGVSCPSWQQNPPLWSLGYEWALYLFAPAIIQLIVWKASLGLRLLAIVLVCAIAATVCDPEWGWFWIFAWFLGAGSYRVLRAGLIPLPAGLLGAGLIIAGMAMALLRAASDLETGTIIAVGTAIAIACRRIVAFPLAPRLFGWVAGFSYTLYASHAPLVFLIVAIFQNIGFPQDKVPPSPAAFMEFGVTIAICLLAAFLVSLVTERKTGQVPWRHVENASTPHGIERRAIGGKGAPASMKIHPNGTLLMIGDSITDCGRVRPVAESVGGDLGNGYVALTHAMLSATCPQRHPHPQHGDLR
jgi:peptidoglycan/LPS O-acetylase OafA/YrhL